MTQAPLIVALDRCLTPADTAAEAALARWTGAVTQGADLPVNDAMLRMLRARADAGQAIWILAAAAEPAKTLLRHLELSAAVLVPDAPSGESPLQAVRRHVGDRFDYLGLRNSAPDLYAAAADTPPLPHGTARTAAALRRAVRPHHSVKNLLVFLPLVAAHQWADGAAVVRAALAFGTLSLAGAAIYLVNDLFDLADDRHNPLKRHRPIAAGRVGVGTALWVAGLCIMAALAVSALTGPDVLILTLAYATGALAYSFGLKTLRHVDLACLAGLYTLRVLTGGAASQIPVSGWLVALSVALFTALACAKRASELVLAGPGGTDGLSRRGYRARDLRGIVIIGALSALGAAGVVLAYARAPQAQALYAHAGWLGGVALVLMLWVGRIWHMALAGRLGTDPILYALRDPLSWTYGVLLGLCLYLAAG